MLEIQSFDHIELFVAVIYTNETLERSCHSVNRFTVSLTWLGMLYAHSRHGN